MHLGLLGGTFDPVHHAHLLVAEAAREACGLDRVIWVPAADPPHKRGARVSPQEHRYAMVVLATASHPCFEVSRVEMERAGPSYTIDTVEHFRRRYPGSRISFIVGADSILEILTWHRHAELIRLVRFIAVTRPGYDLGRLPAVLPPEYLERVDILQAPVPDLSGTAIRDRVRRGLSITYMVPEAVEAYIRKHRLYRPEAEEEPRPEPEQGSCGSMSKESSGCPRPRG